MKEDIFRRIAVVTTITPETHFVRGLLRGLNLVKGNSDNVLAFVSKDEKITNADDIEVVPCWRPNWFFPWNIYFRSRKMKTNLLHIQHEFNMYGGPRGAILFPFLLLLAGKRGKIVVTIHQIFSPREIDSNFLRTFKWPSSTLFALLARLLFRYLFTAISKRSDAIIVHTKKTADVIISEYGAIPSKVNVIPLGIDTKLPRISNLWHARLQGRKVILNFGYVVRRKGLEYLIEAFYNISSKDPNLTLVIAGGTLPGHEDYVDSLKKKVHDMELGSQVLFTGFLSEQEIHELYEISKFVVLPYVYSMAASLPMTLAISHARPLIATTLPNMREEIETTKTGILVPPQDPLSLAQAMESLLSNPELAARLEKSCLRATADRSWENIALTTWNLYAHVLGLQSHK